VATWRQPASHAPCWRAGRVRPPASAHSSGFDLRAADKHAFATGAGCRHHTLKAVRNAAHPAILPCRGRQTIAATCRRSPRESSTWPLFPGCSPRRPPPKLCDCAVQAIEASKRNRPVCRDCCESPCSVGWQAPNGTCPSVREVPIIIKNYLYDVLGYAVELSIKFPLFRHVVPAVTSERLAAAPALCGGALVTSRSGGHVS
jgi:hypothetical protein